MLLEALLWRPEIVIENERVLQKVKGWQCRSDGSSQRPVVLMRLPELPHRDSDNISYSDASCVST